MRSFQYYKRNNGSIHIKTNQRNQLFFEIVKNIYKNKILSAARNFRKRLQVRFTEH